MLLSTTCKACKATIEQPFMVSDRIGLAQKHGEIIELTCAKCGADNTYSPDEFKAISNAKLRLNVFFIAVVTSAIGGLIAMFSFKFNSLPDYFLLFIILVAPLALFLFYIKNDIQGIRLFNRLKLKGHNVDSKISSTAKKVQIASVDKATSVQGKLAKMNKENLPSKRKDK